MISTNALMVMIYRTRIQTMLSGVSSGAVTGVIVLDLCLWVERNATSNIPAVTVV